MFFAILNVVGVLCLIRSSLILQQMKQHIEMIDHNLAKQSNGSYYISVSAVYIDCFIAIIILLLFITVHIVQFLYGRFTKTPEGRVTRSMKKS